jgi:hypothetical protein
MMWAHPLIYQVLVLGMVLSFSFWAKVTTSLALPPCLGLTVFFSPVVETGHRHFHVVRDERSEDRLSVRLWRALLLSGGVSFVGLGIFLFTWSLYTSILARFLRLPIRSLFWKPFHYLLSETGTDLLSVFSVDFFSELLILLVRVVLYLGPFVCLAALVALGFRLKMFCKQRRFGPGDYIYVLTFFVVVAYLILQGGTGSFPKYHLVILPFVCLLGMKGIFRIVPMPKTFPWKMFAVVTTVGVFYYAFVVGDYLFIFNHELRYAAYAGIDKKPVILQILIRGLLYVLFPGLVGWVIHKKFRDKSFWKHVLLASLIASQVGMTASQALGGYDVVYKYGSPLRDFEEVIRVLQNNAEQKDAILALPEFIYMSNLRPVSGMSRGFWDQPEVLAQLIERENPVAVVYGLPTHTLHQMKQVFTNRKLVTILEKGYQQVTVGEYTVWIRR